MSLRSISVLEPKPVEKAGLLSKSGMTRMEKKRLSAIIEAYGADPARWPDGERKAALALMAEQPEMVAERRAASALDSMLAKVPQGMVSDALRTRVLETAPPPQAPSLHKARGGGLRGFGDMIRIPNISGGWVVRPVAILAVAICLGLGAGVLLPLGADAAPSSDTELLTAMWGTPAITQDGANL